MASLSQLIVKISAESSDFDRGIASAQRSALKFSEQLNSIGSTLLRSFTVPLGLLGGAAIKSFGDIDALRRGLEAITGSASEAARQMTQLREVAKLPGLGFREAVQGAINLQAVGFSAKQSQTVLLQFGNALATVGRGREDLNEVIRQLGQLASRGKVTADNLKPIIERVPQAARIINKEFGTIDTEALQKLGVSSQKFIEVLLKGLGDLPRATGGIKNDLENLKDRIDQTLGKLGSAIAPGVSAAIDALDPLLKAAGVLSDTFVALPGPIRTVSLGLAGIAIAAGPILKVVALIKELRVGVLALAATDIGKSIASGLTLTTTAAAPAKAAIDAVAAGLAATGVSAAGAVTGVEAVAASVTKLSTLALGGIAGGIGFGAFLALNELNEFAVRTSTAEKGIAQLNQKFVALTSNVGPATAEINKFGSALRSDSIGQFFASGSRAESDLAKLNARLRETSDALKGAKLSSFEFFDKFFQGVAGASNNLEKLSSAFSTLGIKAPSDLKNELGKLKSALDIVQQAFKEGTKDANGEAVTMDTVRRATEAYNKELKQLTGTKEAFRRATIGNLIEIEQVNRQQTALQGMVKVLADFANAGKDFGSKLATVSEPVSTLTFQLELLGRNSPQAAQRVSEALQELAAIRLPVENLIAYREAVDLRDLLSAMSQPLTPLNRLLDEQAVAAIAASQGTLEFSKRLNQTREAATATAIEIEKVLQQMEAVGIVGATSFVIPKINTPSAPSILTAGEILSKSGRKSALQFGEALNSAASDVARMAELLNQGEATQNDYNAAVDAYRDIERQAFGGTQVLVSRQLSAYAQLKSAIRSTIAEFPRGIATAIAQWRGLGDTVKGVMQDIASHIITFAINKGLVLLGKQLAETSGVIGKIGTQIQEVFGGITKAATQSANAAAGAASAGGDGAGAPKSVLPPIVSAFFEISNFLQGRKMEADIARVEISTRGQLSQLISIQNTLNTYLPNLLNTQLLGSIDSGIQKIYQGLSEVAFINGGSGGGGQQITIGTVVFQLAPGTPEEVLRQVARHLKQVGGRAFAAA